jgi:hypothetical protein
MPYSVTVMSGVRDDVSGVVGAGILAGGGFWVDGVVGCGVTLVFAGGVTVDDVSTARVSAAFSVLTEHAASVQTSASATRVDFII